MDGGVGSSRSAGGGGGGGGGDGQAEGDRRAEVGSTEQTKSVCVVVPGNSGGGDGQAEGDRGAEVASTEQTKIVYVVVSGSPSTSTKIKIAVGESYGQIMSKARDMLLGNPNLEKTSGYKVLLLPDDRWYLDNSTWLKGLAHLSPHWKNDGCISSEDYFNFERNSRNNFDVNKPKMHPAASLISGGGRSSVSRPLSAASEKPLSIRLPAKEQPTLKTRKSGKFDAMRSSALSFKLFGGSKSDRKGKNKAATIRDATRDPPVRTTSLGHSSAQVSNTVLPVRPTPSHSRDLNETVTEEDLEYTMLLACVEICLPSCPRRPGTQVPGGNLAAPASSAKSSPGPSEDLLAFQERFHELDDMLEIIIADNGRLETQIPAFQIGAGRSGMNKLHDAFKSALRSFYGCEPEELQNKKVVRCQVSGMYCPVDESNRRVREYGVVAAHIHPFHSAPLLPLYKKDIATIWSPKNGLSMFKDLEAEFDNHRWFIDYEPTAFAGEGGFVIRLLRKTNQGDKIFKNLMGLGRDTPAATEEALLAEGFVIPENARLKLDSCWADIDGLELFSNSALNKPDIDVLQFSAWMARKQAKHRTVVWNIPEIPNIVKFPGCTIPDVRFRNLEKYLDCAPVHRVAESEELNTSVMAERDAAFYLDKSPRERKFWKLYNDARYTAMKDHSEKLFTDLLRSLGREDLLATHNFDETLYEEEEEEEKEHETGSLSAAPPVGAIGDDPLGDSEELLHVQAAATISRWEEEVAQLLQSIETNAKDLNHQSERIDKLQDPNLEVTERAQITKSFRKKGSGYRNLRKIQTDWEKKFPHLQAADQRLKEAQQLIPEAARQIRDELSHVLAEANRQVADAKELLGRLVTE
ncbi:hypothetical protein BJ508DRAFT_323781 [Ascobolus immersus RN42]|uniref:HNH nuclease domain-containing protein n=1 Tax=Ascobolus immersus RN42 TaxID=1160509 RepID=A0A3N4IEW3_ASCIM|nr:hypothetical protein BJ508DRAFT_323781 [Ascobolus immersus RN42]